MENGREHSLMPHPPLCKQRGALCSPGGLNRSDSFIALPLLLISLRSYGSVIIDSYIDIVRRRIRMQR